MPDSERDKRGNTNPPKPLKPKAEEPKHRRHTQCRYDELDNHSAACSCHGQETETSTVSDAIGHDEGHVGTGNQHENARRQHKGKVKRDVNSSIVQGYHQLPIWIQMDGKQSRRRKGLHLRSVAPDSCWWSSRSQGRTTSKQISPSSSRLSP